MFKIDLSRMPNMFFKMLNFVDINQKQFINKIF